MAVIQGTLGDDTLTGSPARDFLYAWQGNDRLDGSDGDDVMYGDEGNDTVKGGNGNDILAGSQGEDFLEGGDGNDILFGGAGTDTLIGGLGSDRLFGDGGSDRFVLESGADTVTGGQDDDTFILAPSLGGDTEAQAAIITDFNSDRDRLELTGGLTFEQLNIFQGTGFYANDTIIQDRLTGRYLTILLNVPTPSLSAPLTEQTPPPATETPTQSSPIVFADPPLATPSAPLANNPPPGSTPPGTTPPGTPPGTTPPGTPPGTIPPETPPTQSISGTLEFSAANFSVNEDGSAVVSVTVQRTGGNTGAVSGTVTLTNSTATAPADYNNAPITINFGDRDTTSKTITIPIVNDSLIEGTETLNLTLDNPTGGANIGAQSTAILEILDDEVPSPGILQFSAVDFSVNEDGTPVVAVIVTRGGGSEGAVSAQIIPVDGTATAPDDYSNAPVTVNFADGDNTPKTVTIALVDDSLVEGDETVNLSLFNPSGGATLGSQNTATLTIKDNEQAAAVQFSNSTYTVSEHGGTASITVTRSNGNGIVSVDYATSNPIAGTAATAGSDYTATSGSLTFNSGETNKTVSIPILDDTVVEETETVQLTLSNPTGGAQLGTQATATLEIADDEAGILEFASATFSGTEGNSSSSVNQLIAKVKRSGSSDGAVSVQVVLDNPSGTATAPDDYTNNLPIILNWADGDTAEKDVLLPIVEDAIDEFNETINLKLLDASGGATLGTQQTAIYTIVNDDSNLPTAANLVAPTLTDGGGAIYSFTVDYADDVVVDVSSLDNSDIVVTDPNGVSIPATFVSVTPSGNGTPRTATYQIAAPGGSWDAADNGSYSLNLVTNQVFDNTGNAAAAINLGSFTVNALPIVPVVTVAATQGTTLEDSGTALVYTLTRTETINTPLSSPLTVNYTIGGTATTADSDFTALSGSVTFAANSATATVNVTPTADFKSEADETVELILTNSADYSIGAASSAIATIQNDDDTLVTTTADNGDNASPTPGSLRRGMLVANATPGTDTITLSGVSGIISLAALLPAINDDVRFAGPGSNALTISGNNAYRLFEVSNGKSATFDGLTIANGRANQGGGILNNGTAIVNNSTLSGNRAFEGGAILNNGTMTVSNTTISNNQTVGGLIGIVDKISGGSRGGTGALGGAILNNGTLNLSGSTLSNNQAIGGNGSLPLIPLGGLSGVGAGGGGGGFGGAIFNRGTLSISSSLLSDNQAQGGTGGGNSSVGVSNFSQGGAGGVNRSGSPGSFGGGGGGGGGTGGGGTGGYGGGTGGYGGGNTSSGGGGGGGGAFGGALYNDPTGVISSLNATFSSNAATGGTAGTGYGLGSRGSNGSAIAPGMALTYSSPSNGGDRLTGFNPATDELLFNSPNFGGLVEAGFSAVTLGIFSLGGAGTSIAGHELIKFAANTGVNSLAQADAALANQNGASAGGAGGAGGAAFFVYSAGDPNGFSYRVLGYDPDIDVVGSAVTDIALFADPTATNFSFFV